MKKYGAFQKIVASVLALVLMIGLLPRITMPAAAAAPVVTEVVTDPSTSDQWTNILGTSADGTRYAGRVWADKSVYKDGDTFVLNSLENGSTSSTSHTIDLNQADGEYFQVVFSALGSSLASNTTVTTKKPLDVVLILDNSSSMNAKSGNPSTTRMEKVIDAANSMLKKLLDTTGGNTDMRLGIVAYGQNASTVLPFDTYTNGVKLQVSNPTGSGSQDGIITAYDNNNQVINSNYKSGGYANYTNTQSGFDMGTDMLLDATDAENRTPVVILLTDGAANTAKDRLFADGTANVRQVYYGSDIDPLIAVSTLLSAAANKARIEDHYGQKPKVYGVGVDLSATDGSNAIIDPAKNFNKDNVNAHIVDAYEIYADTWLKGNAVSQRSTSGSMGNSRYTFNFGHEYPSGVTIQDIQANINYVDTYYPVSGADVGGAFDSIVENLKNNAFNPIQTSKPGVTGTEETPLIYADNIGKYMEVKDVQAVYVFGQKLDVTKNSDGTYSVAARTGENPATKENWNAAEDIKIRVIDRADGTQQLRVYMDQEILPIQVDTLDVNTLNGVTTSTLTETLQEPLRLFYTVGIKEEILLTNGQVDPAKLDSAYTINADGTVSFYANDFGTMNTQDQDRDNLVELGDAHVGFTPSHENRYYYHQAQQKIFKSVSGIPDDAWNNGYSAPWDEDNYTATEMTYADFATMQPDSDVYTLITFHHLTGSGNSAEEVTYVIRSKWKEIEGSVTFRDTKNNADVYGGAAIEVGQIKSVVDAYKQGKTLADTDLVAVLGLQSRRVSRLNSMFHYKTANDTATAELSYAPAYSGSSHEEGDIHEHREVIIWLGNNGRVKVPVATGLQVTKDVTSYSQGDDANTKFKVQIRLDMDYSDEAVQNLLVTDGEGNALGYVTGSVDGKLMLTVDLADGETARILGVPAGTSYTVTEDTDKYSYGYLGASQTVAGKVVEGTITNEQIRPGTLYVTKEVKHGHGAGYAFPTNVEFKMKTTFIGADGQPLANTTFQLQNTRQPELTSITTDADGVYEGGLYHGETAHILGIPAGTKVKVEEINIPTNYTSTTYTSRNQTNTPEDADGEVTIISDQNATIHVTNTYVPNATTVTLDIAGTKIFELQGSETLDQAGSFTFLVERWEAPNWVSVANKSVQLDYGAGEANSTKSFTIADVLEGVTFDRVGTYTYQVREKIGEVANVTYDRTLYTFTVTVTDNQGQLVATVTDLNNTPITDGSYEVTFKNAYNTAPVSIDIKKTVNNLSGSPAVSKAGFKFVVQTAEVDAQGNWSVKEGGRTFSVMSDGAGEARMVDMYKEAGVYRYILSEDMGAKTGWDFSKAKYYVTVTVTQDAVTGKLSTQVDVVLGNDNKQTETATIDGNYVTVGFTNTYDPQNAEISVNTLATKELAGRALKAGEFSFAIFEDGKASHTDTAKALMLGTNTADGKVTFTATQYGVDQGLVNAANNTLSFGAVGDYYFDVVELTGTTGGMTYDATVYDLVVEVTDPGADGTLEARYYYEDDIDQVVTFKNTYTVLPTNVVIEGRKTLQVNSGARSIHAGEFTFELYQNEAKIAETTNLADGTFRFPELTYGQADMGKTYTYTVKEAKGALGGITYSDAVYTVTVEIQDKGDGTLSANVTGNGANAIHFTNEYDSSPVVVSLPGKKNLANRNITAGEFNFALYRTNATFEGLTLVTDTITHNAAGEFTVELGTLDMGEHYFAVKEGIPTNRAPGIYYSGVQYNVKVTVTDNGNGQMHYTTSVVNANTGAASSIVFDNLYRPADGTLVIDGKKVLKDGPAITAGQFMFDLYDSEDNLLQTAEVKADGTFAFEALTFTADDIGQDIFYTVKEAKGTDPQITYDESVFTVQVIVTDTDKDGALEISKKVLKGGSDAELTFTNTYKPSSITHVIEAEKEYTKELTGGEFTFQLVGNGENQTKKNAAGGTVIFDAVTLDKAGTFTYTVKEIEKTLLFVTYSEAEYEVTLTVINEGGTLKVDSVTTKKTKGADDENDLTFVNAYKYIEAEDQVIITGTKVLTGFRTSVLDKEFSFGLYDETDTLMKDAGGNDMVVSNAADGTFTFPALTYDKDDIGKHTYTVKEIIPAGAVGNKLNGRTYDTTVYTVEVDVVDDNQGHIVATDTIIGANSIIFTNKYEVKEAEVNLKGTKTYDKGLAGNDFTFFLEGEIDGVKVKQEKKNDANGNIVFDTLKFTKEGTYEFTVKELDEALGFIEYSKVIYKVKIEVKDNNAGQLVATMTVNDKSDGTITFTNDYKMVDADNELTLTGTKTLTGRDMVAGEFAFGLYDSENKLIETVTNDASGAFAFTKLTYQISEGATKEYTYTVKEIAGTDPLVTYDTTAYTVKVTVKDNGKGEAVLSYTINNKADGKIAFANTYTAPAPVNAKIYIQKNVVNKTETDIGLDGFTFQLECGEQKLTVESDKNGKAGFQMTFGVEHVGKTFELKISEVKGKTAGMTYDTTVHTVKVKVLQNADGSLALTINDKAADEISLSFTNTYEKPATPVTGDNFPIFLVGAVLLLSAAAIVVLLIKGKKKSGRYTK